MLPDWEGSRLRPGSPRPRRRNPNAKRKLRAAAESLESRVLFTTYTVNDFVDRQDFVPGDMSLREAIILANDSGGGTINLPAGNYPLKLGNLVIQPDYTQTTLPTESVTLQAVGGQATIDGQNLGGVLAIRGQSNVSMSGITFTGGNGSIGAAIEIESAGALTLNSCTVSGNNDLGNVGSSYFFDGAAGISNFGTVILNHTTVIHNTSGLNQDGGGIFNDGMLTLDHSTVSQNHSSVDGGGVFNLATLVVDHSSITDNTAAIGGGMCNDGVTTLLDSQISNDTVTAGFGGGDFPDGTGGGVYNSGTLTVTDCTFDSDSAVAIFGLHNLDGGNGSAIENVGTLTATASTFSNNQSNLYSDFYEPELSIGTGGTLDNSGSLMLFNCTFTGNLGNSLTNTASAEVVGCTFANDATSESGQLFNSDGATLSVANSIVAGNRAGASLASTDVSGDIRSQGHNLIGVIDGSTGWQKSDLTGTLAHPLDPKLTPLGDFGGATMTQVPTPASPAIGAGSTALVPKATTTDQRGYPRITGGKVDIGAVQTRRRSVITIAPPSPQSAVVGTAKSMRLGSFTDVGGAGPYRVEINWDDGTPDSIFSLKSAGTLGSVSHEFLALGALHGTIFVSDSLGEVSNATHFSVVAAAATFRAFVVNTTKDQNDAAGSKTVSLRDAVSRADAGFGPARISFDPSIFATAQTITLNSSLSFSHDRYGLISLAAPAAGITLHATHNATLTFGPGVTAGMSNITFTGAGSGGIINNGNLSVSHCNIVRNGATGILNTGTLNLSDSLISGNTATLVYDPYFPIAGDGGGISNSGIATITRCTIAGNNAANGGGIANGGTLTLTGSIVSNNSGRISGGGIMNSGTLILAHDSISNNSSPDNIGGGVENYGEATVDYCTFVNNNAANGGAIECDNGSVSIDHSTFSHNSAIDYGGAIDNSVTLSVSNSTFSGNTAGLSGGGIYNLGSATLVNCTLAGNSTGGEGGAISNVVDYNSFANSSISISNCTIAANAAETGGAGIYNSPKTYYAEAIATITNTLIANNTSPEDPELFNVDVRFGPDTDGIFQSLGHNLVGNVDHSAGWIRSDMTGSPLQPLDARVTPLGMFGGPTQTIGLFAGSPALGAGSVALLPAGVTTDQRGQPRVRSKTIDIGAVETNGLARMVVTAPAAPLVARIGGTISVPLGSFTNTGGAAPFFVNVNWGDGSPDTVVPMASAGVIPRRNHAFLKSGTLTVSVSVTDSALNSSNVSTFVVSVLSQPPRTLVVNTVADQIDAPGSNIMSLRDAVAIADASFTTVSITFDPAVFNTGIAMVLQLGKLKLINNAYGVISITAPASPLSITSSDADVLFVGQKTTARITHLIVKGDSEYSGAIDCQGNLTLTDCDVFDGAVENTGTMTLTNCTLGRSSQHGGIYNGGVMSIIGCTIVAISGIQNDDAGTLSIGNSIVAGNSPYFSDVDGAVTSLGHNIIGAADQSSGWQSSDRIGTLADPINPMLDYLGYHGGTIPVFPLLPGSPAIDAGDNTLIPPGDVTDERGQPRIDNGVVDIGAVEV